MYIAFAGKGSSGKSTIVASLIAYLRTHTNKHPLIIDADPHQSLCNLMKVQPPTTLGSLRSEYERALLTGRDAALRTDETRIAFAERLLAEKALYQTEQLDLLAIGQWELPGSQCTPNRVLGYALADLLPRYALTIVDHEAGVEHIGRFRDIPIDSLIVVATPDILSLDVAWRILDQAHAVGREVRFKALILNRVQEGDLADPKIAAQVHLLHDAGVPLLAALPESPQLRRGQRIGETSQENAWDHILAGIFPQLIGA